MIDTLVIVVYDRLENLRKYFHILKQCNPIKQVVVIHNYDSPQDDYKELCEQSGAIYIYRNNIGFDIGAFQDVCRNRLKGFPEWDQLIWVTDDTIPTVHNFTEYFDLKQGEGVRCMEISPYVRQHIRTTGFSIAKSTAIKLKFVVDPITTKRDCYTFEHRDIRNTFMDQVKRMGLSVKMVASQVSSPLFDTGYHRRLNRDPELNKLWGLETVRPPVDPTDVVTFVCPIYKSFPAIISSLIMQTNRNWELWLIHDGPGDGSAETFIQVINDDRIKYFETHEHKGMWGHYIRSEWLQKVKTKYVIISNPDNYYTPVFIERCFVEFKKRRTSIGIFCLQMVHSYTNWGVINCRFARGFIDCGGVMLKTKEAVSVGWNNITDHSADWFFFNDIAKAYGVNKFTSIPGCLFQHN